MNPTPLLFYGDSPALQTGLGRVMRDLACLACRLPQFRVGALGRGSVASRQLPFPQYTFPEADQWGEWHLERVWKDFASGANGIVMTIWDPTRLLWFSRPTAELAELYRFLKRPPFTRWGYFPVDATGPDGGLGTIGRAAVQPYESVLAYTAWGAQVLSASLGRTVSWLPHGFNGETFRPLARTAGRMALGVPTDALLIGCNMTNQERKDWGLWAASMALVRQKQPNLHLWIHVDMLLRRWSLPALLEDYGLADIAHVTICGSKSDTELAYLYSACDLTVLPSLGEGFGYPLIESMACGVPVVHGNYGGGAELVPEKDWLVEPVNWRVDGLHNMVRPVYDPVKWAVTVGNVLNSRPSAERCRSAVEHLDWRALWPSVWEKWFLEGVGCES